METQIIHKVGESKLRSLIKEKREFFGFHGSNLRAAKQLLRAGLVGTAPNVFRGNGCGLSWDCTKLGWSCTEPSWDCSRWVRIVPSQIGAVSDRIDACSNRIGATPDRCEIAPLVRDR